MNCNYILHFTYNNKYINDQLIPFQEFNNSQPHSDILEQYQIGVAITCPSNHVQIITPFFIHIPYSECRLLIIGSEPIKLKLYNYCYHMRLASYIIEDQNNINKIFAYTNINSIKLDNLDQYLCYINQIDNEIIPLININIQFNNLLNDNIYPFIWINGEIDNSEEKISDDENILDDILPGTIVYKYNKQTQQKTLLGIIYNVIDEKIQIIPLVSIIKVIKKYKLKNIFFDYNMFEKSLIINQIYSNKNKKLEIGDIIYKINNKNVNRNGTIYCNFLKIVLPIHTYLWYINNNKINFTIIRNDNLLDIEVTKELLNEKLSFEISNKTTIIEKDNIIFCKPNLLMIEWLIENDIVPRNILYLEYKINPFYKKNTYFFVGFTNILEQPLTITNILCRYLKSTDNFDIFTILNINNSRSLNINQFKNINSLSLLDSNEQEIILDW